MASRAPNPAGSRKISFNVSEQYDIQDVVGEGAYGVVWYVWLALPRHFEGIPNCGATTMWFYRFGTQLRTILTLVIDAVLRSISRRDRRSQSRRLRRLITPCFVCGLCVR